MSCLIFEYTFKAAVSTAVINTNKLITNRSITIGCKELQQPIDEGLYF